MAKCLVMVYISADDVLANFAIDSLNQLRRAASPDIVVKALFNPPGSTGLVRSTSLMARIVVLHSKRALSFATST